jgi:TRAP-type C4-dicarboxylate transport system permease small subunit
MSTQSTGNGSINGEGRQRPFSSPPFMSQLRKLVVLLDWSGCLIAVACLAMLFAALLANVILRYFFGSGIAWAYEIHALLLPWMVAGGMVIASARGSNIAITLLPEVLKASQRRTLRLIINAVIAVISVSVLWSGQPILKASNFQSLSTLGIKQIWGYSSMVYAFGGMAVIALIEAVSALFGTDSVQEEASRASFS